MSNYYDPRWYEDPEHNENHVSSQQPTFHPLDQFSSDQPTQSQNNGHNGLLGTPQPQQPSSRIHRMQRFIGKFIVLAAVIVIAFLAGWFGNQLYSHSLALNSQSQYYENLFQQAWTIVDQNYVNRKQVNYQKMSYQAITAMVQSLGDTGHTRFLTPADVKSENQQLSGAFTGIGIYLQQDPKTGQLVIASPIPGSPAEKAGLRHGDVITAVNGKSTKGLNISGVSTLIQGPAGTSVKITIYRASTKQTLTFTITRAVINVPNVLMHYIAQDHIADIQIVQFSDGVSSQLKTDLQQAKKDGATKIILDLRENPGGYLSEAVDTASEFIKSGNVLLEEDSSGTKTPVPVTGSTINTTSPIVVLVNHDTASAAEIVSGALQDDHRGIVMGITTFGTGTVLQQFNLSDGSAILLGTQEWLTPDGKSIFGNGITPNIKVSDPKNVILTPDLENANNMSEQQILNSGDAQLAAAIKYLESH